MSSFLFAFLKKYFLQFFASGIRFDSALFCVSLIVLFDFRQNHFLNFSKTLTIKEGFEIAIVPCLFGEPGCFEI